MKSKIEIIEQLRACKTELNTFGVAKIGLFGSVVRNEAADNSDIDILVDFENDKETYFNFLSVCNLLEKIFINQKLDIVSEKGLSPFIGPYILKEVEYV